MRAKLTPIVQKRRELGRVDTEIAGLSSQRESLDQRVAETRESLRAIQKDPRAGALRKRLGERLDGFLKEADAIGRRIVELQSARLELKIALEDLLEHDADAAAPSAVEPATPSTGAIKPSR
jgi:chromosome segregation ATPase